MNSTAGYFVALSPSRQFDDDILKQAADLLHTDAYNVRLLLAGEMPRIIAEFRGPEEAEALADKLRGLGLAAVAGSNSDLQQTAAAIFVARNIEAADKAITFRGEAETRKINRDDAFLILEGVCEIPGTGITSGKPEKKLNIPMTLLLGIPINKKVKRGPVVASAYERFLRVYSRASQGPVVEFRMGGMDYSFLGEKKGFSSTANFAIFTGELRGLFPNAVFDSRLTRVFPYATPETLEPNCRLIYLFHIAAPVNPPGD